MASPRTRFDRGAIVHWACLGVLAGVLLPAWGVATASRDLFPSVQGFLVALGIAAGIGAIACCPDLMRRRALSPAEWCLGAFLVVGSMGVLLGPVPVAQFVGTLRWIEAALLVALLARLADVSTLRRFLLLYGWMAVAISLIFIAYLLLGLNDLWLPRHRNQLALLIIIPICTFGLELAETRGVRQLLPGSALLALLITLTLTRSRAVMLGVSIGIAVAFFRLLIHDGWRLRRRATLARLLTWVVLAGAALAGLEVFLQARGATGVLDLAQTVFHVDEGSIGGRWRRWQNAWSLIQAHPWLGRGLESWHPAFEAVRHSRVADPSGYPSAASTYVRIASEGGLLGLLAFLAFCGLVVSQPVQRRIEHCLRLAFVVLLIALLFHSAQDHQLTLAGFGISAGLALWRDRASDPDAEWPKRQIAAWLLVAAAMLTLQAKYTLSSLEAHTVRVALSRGTISNERLLWRLLDPVSTIIQLPMNRETVLARHDGLQYGLRWTKPGPGDPFLAMARALHDTDNLAAAEEWFRGALRREPTSLRAMKGLCDVRERLSDVAGARAYCEQMLLVHPDEPNALASLAEFDLRSGDVAQAYQRLSTARRVWWSRLDINDFGVDSLKQVARNYQEYRRVSSERAALAGVASELISSATLDDIAQVPLLHSVIAAWGCRLYFSANINARYNLWEVDTCEDPLMVVPRTNDARAPYQLKATAEGVYFVSDDRGDGRYALYFLGHEAKTARKVALPKGRLETHAVNPATGELAVISVSNGHYRLWLAAARGGLREVYADERRLSDVAASPVGGRWVFVADGRELLEWAGGETGIRTILQSGDFRLGRAAYAPGGDRLVVARQLGPSASEVVTLQAEQPPRVIFTSESGLAIDPLWTTESTIVFREKLGDEYLLRVVDEASGRVSPLGPQQGVVYPPTFDAASHTLWFARAGIAQPKHLMGLDLEGDDPPMRLTLDWISPDQVLPTEVSTLTTAEGRALVYSVAAAEPKTGRAVVWLHGGGDAYSPRWHSIAQTLAHHGYRVAALNYSTRWSVERGAYRAPSRVTAEEVERLVARLRAEGTAQVHLLGVSAGTEVLQAVLQRGRAQITSAIEFAPIPGDFWDAPPTLPPMLIVAGENDPGFQIDRRRIEAHRTPGSPIDLLILENEGHDLRGRKGIHDRIAATLQFLASQSGTAPRKVASDAD